MQNTAMAERSHSLESSEKHGSTLPIFSAFEVGRKVLTVQRLKELSGYDYALPLEDDPAVQVYELYRNFPDLQYLPVMDSRGQISGYTLRNQFLAILSKNHYSRELMLRPDVKLKSMMRTGPVILDAHATLSEASSALMARPEESRFDPFVVTMEDRFYGISTVDLVLRGMNSFLRRDNEACLEAQHALLQWQPGERWEPGNIPSASVQKYTRTAESREIATLDFSRYVSPLSGPGGDFSQCYDFSNQSQLFMLFDVCGKGLKASSMVSIIGTTLHSALRYEIATGESDNTRVRKLLEKLNAITYELSPAEMYATGIALLVNRKRKIASVYDFGHGMLWIARNHRAHRLEKSGIGNSDQAPFLGMHSDLLIQPVHYRLQDGDLLFSCSDGILEQRDGSGEMFGSHRIEEILSRTRPEPERINREMLQYWESFREDARATDDLSMMSIFLGPARA